MHYSSQRQVSGPQPLPNGGMSYPTSSTLSPTSSANGINHNSFGAVLSPGGSTGKSGQFIERLQNENATLRREYNVERSAKEEAQKSLSASKTIESKLIAENSRLELLQSTNARAIERKNRKIEELRASLEAETDRRKAAEAREQQMASELDNTHTETNKAISEAFTAQKRAEANADALKDGLHRLQARYERQVQTMTKQLSELRTRQQEDRAKLLALDVSGDQRRQEIRHSDEVVERMQKLMILYKNDQTTMFDRLESEAAEMRQIAEQRGQRSEQLISEMEQARDKMNWVVGVHNARKA